MRVIAIKNLWSHEVWSTSVRLHVMLSVLGQAKINQSDFAVCSIHDVFRFDIAMSDSECVAVLESRKALADNFSCLSLGIRLALFEVCFVTVKELSTRA